MDFAVEELEREHQIRLRLGYQPEAAPPDLANVKSRINNKHIASRKYYGSKKSTKGAQNTSRFVSGSPMEIHFLLTLTYTHGQK